MSDHDDKESENVKSDWFYEQNHSFLPVTRFFFYVCDVKLSYAKIYTGRELEKEKQLKTDEEFPFSFKMWMLSWRI